MKRTLDLSQLTWEVAGFTPNVWRRRQSLELGMPPETEVSPVAAPVPGSVQMALRNAGLLPDWNVAHNARQCEWVENRHWVYQTRLPDEPLADGRGCRLVCDGLDHAGWVYLNGREVGTFANGFRPHVFDLTPALRRENNLLQIIFDVPPRWLGHCGWTDRIRDWKARFNFTWDWTVRLVQIGIWDGIRLEVTDGVEIGQMRCVAGFDAAAGTGTLKVWGAAGADEGARVRLSLRDGGSQIRVQDVSPARFADGVDWRDLPVAPWWPNGMGDQPLYTLRCELLGAGGEVVDARQRRVGFKTVTWEDCANAPAGATPWICVVNGRRVFLQGVNWTPIRPNYADVPEEDYRRRVATYRDLGCNVLRVWGGAVIGTETFYDLCDEMGLLVWQEFPLSSSGLGNWPPEDETSMAELVATAASYVARRQHHASLLMWCGGNELQRALDGGKDGCGRPVDGTHPLMQRFAKLVAEQDPGRRFVPSSSSGPRFLAEEADFGKGLHWDVHGPWRPPGGSRADWARYWAADDALFRSELGAPGASPADIIQTYAGDLPVLPGSMDNDLWRRTAWWIDWPDFLAENGRNPTDLDEYVRWSQARQADALRMAVAACKRRFPRIGGVILWMGHDSFPCMINTAILDLHGRPKPAAPAVGEVFRTPPESL